MILFLNRAVFAARASWALHHILPDFGYQLPDLGAQLLLFQYSLLLLPLDTLHGLSGNHEVRPLLLWWVNDYNLGCLTHENSRATRLIVLRILSLLHLINVPHAFFRCGSWRSFRALSTNGSRCSAPPMWWSLFRRLRERDTLGRIGSDAWRLDIVGHLRYYAMMLIEHLHVLKEQRLIPHARLFYYLLARNGFSSRQCRLRRLP